jgi:hypothetical protein
MSVYWCSTAPMPTTVTQAKIATGTGLKTLLQVATPSTMRIAPVAWGISFDGSVAGTPIPCELIETNIAATVLAHAANSIQPYNDPGAPTSLVVTGTAGTGYNASAENSITATRTADLQLVAPTNQYAFVWPLGREFKVGTGKWLRIRVHAAATVNAHAWIAWEEAS